MPLPSGRCASSPSHSLRHRHRHRHRRTHTPNPCSTPWSTPPPLECPLPPRPGFQHSQSSPISILNTHTIPSKERVADRKEPLDYDGKAWPEPVRHTVVCVVLWGVTDCGVVRWGSVFFLARCGTGRHGTSRNRTAQWGELDWGQSPQRVCSLL